MTRSFYLVVFVSALVSGCGLSPSPHIQMTLPDEALAAQLRAEIWSDIESNALIGNGNDLAAAWANAGGDRDKAPLLHIQELRCGGSEKLLRCRFGLVRDGGIATYLGEPTPDRLDCKANFVRVTMNVGWSIPRLPPRPKGGHSRITIKCQPVI